MKLAYLIIAHTYPKLLRRLVESIRHPGVTIFIHIDLKSDIDDFAELNQFDDVIFVPDRVAVYWGDFSQVRSELSLLRYAQTYGPFDYYQLLSGTDYPVRSNHAIFERLAGSDSEYIEYFKMPISHKPLNRIENYWVPGAYNNPKRVRGLFLRTANKIVQQLAYVYKRNYKKYWGNMTPYGGSIYWTLTQGCVDYIIHFLDTHPEFFEPFRFALCPDELFFQTIILNSPFKNKVMPSLNYVDWSNRHIKSPPEINEDHIHYLAHDLHWHYARKFSEDNYHLLDIIDRQLRSQPVVLPADRPEPAISSSEVITNALIGV